MNYLRWPFKPHGKDIECSICGEIIAAYSDRNNLEKRYDHMKKHHNVTLFELMSVGIVKVEKDEISGKYILSG